jgi:3-oxoadipate enol-lactonase
VEWVELNGTVLRVAIEGQGPPLVLVHEIGGMIESYDDIVPLLRENHQIVRFDIRGSGLSEFAIKPLTFEVLIADLLALLDHFALPRVSIAGCALGAAIAIAFAIEHPERVERVVAMSPALSIPPERRAATLARAKVFETEGMRPTHEARLSSSYPQALRADRERFERVFRRRLSASPYGVAALVRLLADSDVMERLPRLTRPMLVVAGTYDGDRPPSVVRPVADAAPGAKFIEIASGHFMPSQTPDRVAKVLNEFLAAQPETLA